MNPKNNQIVFDEYRGSPSRGFGLTWYDDSEVTTFSLVHNSEITAQFELQLVIAADFCDVQAQSSQRLIIASMAEGSGFGVHAFTLDDAATQVTISQTSTRTRADKLRIMSMGGNYYAFGLDKTTNLLTIWTVTIKKDDIVFEIVTTVQKVQDYDPANSADTIFLYFITLESSVGSVIPLKPTFQGVDVGETSSIPFDSKKPYWFESIACNNKSNGTGATCAFNTFGTVIYAADQPFTQPAGLKATVYETYNKLAGFDGS